jgi:hypothetical protein
MLGQAVAGTIQPSKRECGKFVGHAVSLSLEVHGRDNLLLFRDKGDKANALLTPGPSSHSMHNPHPGQLPGASPLADPSEADPTSPLQPTGVNWAENDYADRALEGQ